MAPFSSKAWKYLATPLGDTLSERFLKALLKDFLRISYGIAYGMAYRTAYDTAILCGENDRDLGVQIYSVAKSSRAI